MWRWEVQPSFMQIRSSLMRYLSLFFIVSMSPFRSWVIFTNTLRVAFAPIFFHQKISKPNSNWRKAVQSTFIQKNVDKIDA